MVVVIYLNSRVSNQESENGRSKERQEYKIPAKGDPVGYHCRGSESQDHEGIAVKSHRKERHCEPNLASSSYSCITHNTHLFRLQWFLSFLVLQPFNIVSHVVVTPNHNIIFIATS